MPISFTPEIYQIVAVRLFGRAGPWHAGSIRFVGKEAGLNVGDNQGRLTFKRRAFGGVWVCQSFAPRHTSQINRGRWLIDP